MIHDDNVLCNLIPEKLDNAGEEYGAVKKDATFSRQQEARHGGVSKNANKPQFSERTRKAPPVILGLNDVEEEKTSISPLNGVDQISGEPLLSKQRDQHQQHNTATSHSMKDSFNTTTLPTRKRQWHKKRSVGPHYDIRTVPGKSSMSLPSPSTDGKNKPSSFHSYSPPPSSVVSKELENIDETRSKSMDEDDEDDDDNNYNKSPLSDEKNKDSISQLKPPPRTRTPPPTRQMAPRTSSLQDRLARRQAGLSTMILYINDYKDVDSEVSYGDDDEETNRHRTSFRSISVDEEDKPNFSRCRSIVERICLNPQYPLQKQLFLSFGIASGIAILFVVCTGIFTTTLAGMHIESQSHAELIKRAEHNMGCDAQYVAESVSQVIDSGLNSIMVEMTQDRFAGYPDFEDEEYEDAGVPFMDKNTGRNMYPLNRSSRLPFDWEIVNPNVNAMNSHEHVQDRYDWYGNPPTVSTASAFYRMQGQCDSSVTDPTSILYYPNCTDANNDITTGGVVQPTSINLHIAKRAADLEVMLKPLYEYHSDIKALGVTFLNSGAGSAVFFPSAPTNGRASYTSAGCDYLASPNPYDPSRTIATPSEISRCHPIGSKVPGREYNALERSWCRDQILHPEQTRVIGPYVDIFSETLMLTFGKAVYDRKTKNLIGCTMVDVSVGRISNIIQSSRLDDIMSSQIALVKWDEAGTVVASSTWEEEEKLSSSMKKMSIAEMDIGIGIDVETFEKIKSLVDYDTTDWDASTIRRAYNVVFRREGRIILGYPVPPPPESISEGETYRPSFMVIVSMHEEDALEAINTVGRDVDEHVDAIIRNTLIVGVSGLVVVLLVLYMGSRHVARPLRWMNRVGDQIVNSFGENHGDPHHNDDGVVRTTPNVNINVNVSIDDMEQIHTLRCSPKTEITALVVEFQKLLQNFSGKGTAKIVKKNMKEVKNPFYLFNIFKDLYYSRSSSDFQYGYQICVPPPIHRLGSPGSGGDDMRRKNSTFSGHTWREETVCTDESVIHEHRGSLLTTEFPEFDEDEDELGQTSTHTTLPPSRQHYGRNVISKEGETLRTSTTSGVTDIREASKRHHVVSSRLFWWIIVCIMTPLLVTMVIISFLVTWNVSQEFPALVTDLETLYLETESTSLGLTANLRANFAEQVMSRSLRDLHVYSRIANWLLSGEARQSDSFTEMITGVDMCKTYANNETCGYLLNEMLTPCDCSWDDVYGHQCQVYDDKYGDGRYLQKMWFAGQSQDTWPNGDRNSTSYPAVSNSPETTSWWKNTSQVPGWNQEEVLTSSSGAYSTTYDRLRVSSALSTIQMPLYNYRIRSGESKHQLGLYLAFEADGMILGYTGCDQRNSDYSKWRSTEENGAYRIRPELCPIGKYGFDPRCRNWYETGKKYAESGGNGDNGALLHVTAPYVFAPAQGIMAQSATLPLMDSSTGEYIGQSLIDFFPKDIIDMLKRRTSLTSGGFPILITPEVDNFGADTVVGPGFTLNGEGASISDLIFPYDDCSMEDLDVNDGKEFCKMKQRCRNKEQFNQTLQNMRAGKSGRTVLTRSNQDGEQEKFNFAYAPVFGTNLKPRNSSDFTSGVDLSRSLMFSLGLAEPFPGLLSPFQDIRDNVLRQARISLAALGLFIVLAAVVVSYISWRATVWITVPISQLCTVVKDMNNYEVKEMPFIFGGSEEVSKVYKTFENLYKVVRGANSSYFSGDVKKAYTVLVDSLTLFKQLKNKKAVGVVSNNLGNTILSLYVILQETGRNEILGMSKRDLIGKGMVCFDEAINIGEEAIQRTNEEMGFSLDYLVFMQQLSNRYFNRAMFLLMVRNDHVSPREAKKLGLSDLLIARDMDLEFMDQCAQEGFTFDEEERFNLRLGRARGLLLLLDMSYSFDWDVEEILEDCLETLQNALRIPRHDLFRDLSSWGQMQQLDAVLINFLNHKQRRKIDVSDAARVGIRMLVEDEYVIPEAAVKALDALINYIDSGEMKGLKVSPAQVMKKLTEYKGILLSRAGDKSLLRRSTARSIRGDVTMEVF